MQDDTSTGTPERIPELWFSDGNIVVLAGDLQYRVFGGILAAQSPVFQDMLAFPQPADSEMVDGCPVVRLHDSPTDVTSFLKAIFIPEFFLPPPAKTTFDIITGCLRISHKYGVDYLFRRALTHLSTHFPTDLPAYEDLLQKNKSGSLTWETPKDASYLILVLELARVIDSPWILPLAFYWLSVYFRQLGTKIFRGTSYNGVCTRLSLDDQDTFLEGHHRQIENTGHVLRFLTDTGPIPACESPRQCRTKRTTLELAVREVGLKSQFLSHCLGIWKDSMWESLQSEQCAGCLVAIRQTHREAVQVFWNELPDTYALPSWEELNALRLAAIGPT